MKKLKVNDNSQCMACLQCVRACSEGFYKTFDQDKAALKVTEKADKTLKVLTCIQCGKCARACEHEAITQNAKGVYMVNKKLCVGCGKCVEACPFGVMVLAEEGGTASKCIACGLCAKQCPMGILEVVEA